MKRILIIDDEKDFCYFLKRNLEAYGTFDIAICCDSVNAIEEVKKLQPDLILIDILMPKITGSEIAAELIENKNTKDIPFIFLTAIVKEEETETRKNIIGGQYFVAKPVKIDGLIKIINQLIG
jgi:CheY-like chemotaxis protein